MTRALASICLLVLAAAHAAASPATEQLFREGRELFNLGKTDEACEKFQQARALESRSGIVLALAGCRERQGRLATAWEMFIEAKTLAVREKRDRSVRVADLRAAEIANKRAFMTIVVPEKHRVPGLVVTRDGKPFPSWDQELPADPGVHVIEATAPGYDPVVLHIDVVAQGKATVIVPALVKHERRDLAPESR